MVKPLVSRTISIRTSPIFVGTASEWVTLARVPFSFLGAVANAKSCLRLFLNIFLGKVQLRTVGRHRETNNLKVTSHPICPQPLLQQLP